MIPHELKELAAACGVLLSYKSVDKQQKEATIDSLLAVIGALDANVQTLDDVPGALAERKLSKLRQGIEPVIIAWDGVPPTIELTVPASEAKGTIHCTVELESGEDPIEELFHIDKLAAQPVDDGRYLQLKLRLSSPAIPWGYHRLCIDRPNGGLGRTASAHDAAAVGSGFQSLLISSPSRGFTHGNDAPREWGCFLPLYALRSERNWGAGDFTDLRNLGTWVNSLGGRVIGTLPLLAAYLKEPFEPSPYSPASRLAWNEFYIDVNRIPDVSNCPGVREFLESERFNGEVTKARDGDLVDYRSIMAMKRQALEMLAADFFAKKPPSQYMHFQNFLLQHPHIQDYAEFRATYERCGEPWQRWPVPQRQGNLSERDYDLANKQYHLYSQWIATTQLEELADELDGGLYLDLPLGVRPDGYDVWRCNAAYACGSSAGSPPDAVWTNGQNWGFPPLHPERIREDGYRHVRDYLKHHLRLARTLRIDHVMQLYRLFWIPDGMTAAQGVYVRYRQEELYAILNLESHRCQTLLIGENLGTVPPEVDEAMERHGMRQMYVMQYEAASSALDEKSSVSGPSPEAGRAITSTQETSLPADRSLPRPEAEDNPIGDGDLAALNTHDMPPFSAWWRGDDIRFRNEMGLVSEAELQGELQTLQRTKSALIRKLQSEGWLEAAATGDDDRDQVVMQALHQQLAASPAGVVLINLEDLWQETRPQNIPGTGQELPNWRRKASKTLEAIAADQEIVESLHAVDQLRRRSKGAN